jgi:hypothetical protein
MKDCHLIEGALFLDKRIASLDEQVRSHLASLANLVDCIKPILWLNPTIAKEKAVHWLENGAPDEKSRRLKS